MLLAALALPAVSAGGCGDDDGAPGGDAGWQFDSGASDGGSSDSAPPDTGTDDAGATLDAAGADAAGGDGGGADASRDSGPTSDAGPLPDLGRFSAPTLVTALSNPAADTDPAATGDLLELYFASTRPGGMGEKDIWRSVRASVDDPWSAPLPVAELNTGEFESTPKVSFDGLTMWFSSTRGSDFVQEYDIWMSRRPDRSSPWRSPLFVTELGSDTDEGSPATDRTELTMVLHSARLTTPTVRALDLFQCTRAGTTDAWSEPALLTELHLPGVQTRDPALALSGQLLLFARGPIVEGTFPVLDLFASTRAGPSAAFGAPLALAELDSGDPAVSDEDPWISEDGRHVFFTSNRSGDFEIYEATR